MDEYIIKGKKAHLAVGFYGAAIADDCFSNAVDADGFWYKFDYTWTFPDEAAARAVAEKYDETNKPPSPARTSDTEQHDSGGELIGIGGAPTRATTLPTEGKARKQYPVASGVLDYFPDALVAISRVSWQGNEQHNPGQLLHWDRAKSQDEADTLMRHFLQRGTLDSDGQRHSAKLAWRACALLQKEIEAER